MKSYSKQSCLAMLGKTPIPDVERVTVLSREIQAHWMPLKGVPEAELTHEQRARRRRGKRALDELVLGNARLMIPPIRQRYGVDADYSRFVGAGIQGLMVAAERFDPDKGFRFSTYATGWIRSYIGRAPEGNGPIRWPEHLKESMTKLRQFVLLYRREHGRYPDVEAIAAHLGKSVERIKELMKYRDQSYLLELDRPLNADQDDSGLLLDAVPDGKDGPSDYAEEIELCESVQRAIAELPEQQGRAIRMRFGIETGETLPHSEIAAQMGFSRQYSRQLVELGLRRLKKSMTEV